MARIYDKVYKVPVWVVVKEGCDSKTLMKWFSKKEALIQDWPAASYKDTLLTFKNKGWKEYLNEGVALPPQLVMLSLSEHMKKAVAVTSQLIFTNPVHRVNRLVTNESDYARIADEALVSQTPIVLSQVFQIAERAHNDSGPSSRVWVTVAPCNEQIISQLSNKIITIGEGENCSINIKDVDKKELPEYLETKFAEILNQ